MRNNIGIRNIPEIEKRKSETPSEKELFSITCPVDTDSTKSTDWKLYLDKEQLLEAWSVPEGSPFKEFQKTKSLNSVNKYAKYLQPRYSEGEARSEEGIRNLIDSGLLGNNTAVVLDSGGAHSIAMATQLAKKLGYQPVVMFDAEPHPKGANRVEQELATLLYFSNEIKELKAEGRIKATAPPVFILDAHRDEFIHSSNRGKVFDNTHTYETDDFPSAETLKRHGIENIVYLNEGDQNGGITEQFQSLDRVHKDLKQPVSNWEQSGLKILYTGVKPWPDEDEFMDFDLYD